MHTSSTLFRQLNSVVGPIVKSGVTSPLPVGTGVVLLETIGRTSGKPRQVPVLATRVGNKMYMSTVRPDSQWVRNIEADPNVQVWLYGRPRHAVAKVTRGPLNVVELSL